MRRPLIGQTQRVTYLGFTPDDRMLASSSADGTVALWDVGSQKPIGSPLVVERDTFTAVALSPDGSRLFAVSNGDRGVRLETAPAAWDRHACLVAGRELNSQEWKDVLPERPHQAVCRRG